MIRKAMPTNEMGQREALHLTLSLGDAADGWTVRHKGIDWPCRTEQDALGVLVYLRDFGRQPLAIIAITPAPSEAIASLLATLPNQQGQLL